MGQRPAGVPHDIVPVALRRRAIFSDQLSSFFCPGDRFNFARIDPGSGASVGEVVTVDEQIGLAVGAHRTRRDHHPALGQEVDAFAECPRLQFAGISVVEVLAVAGSKHRRRRLRINAVESLDRLEPVGDAVLVDVDDDKAVDLARCAVRRRRSAIASTMTRSDPDPSTIRAHPCPARWSSSSSARPWSPD